MKNIHKFIKYVVDNWNYPLNEDEIKLDRNRQKFFDKFKEEADTYNIEIDDDILKKYILFFDQIKNSPNVTIKDLSQVSLKQLIRWVNANRKAPGVEKEIEQNPDVIYKSEDGNIIIYDGSNNDRCIIFGSGERWCITRGSFSSYRYSDYRGFPVFYLARNRALPKEDKLSFVAIQVRDPKIKREEEQYVYTNRKNSPYESRPMSFNQLLNEVPWLKEIPDLKTKLRYVPLSRAEKQTHQQSSRGMSYEEWTELPPDFKEGYLTARGQQLRNSTNSALFSDMSYDEFLSQELPKDINKEIAEFIAITPGVIPSSLLLKNLSFFKDGDRRSIIANFRDKFFPDEWLSNRKLPFDVKVLLTNLNKWAVKPTETVFTINSNKAIIYLTSSPKLGIFTPSETYPNVKINNKTLKTILDAPEFNPTSTNPKTIPIDIVLSLLNISGLDPSITGKLKSMIDKDPNIIKVTNDQDDLLIINKNDLNTYTSKDNVLKKTKLDNTTIEFLQDSNPEALETIKSSAKDIVLKYIQEKTDPNSSFNISYYDKILDDNSKLINYALESIVDKVTPINVGGTEQDLLGYRDGGGVFKFFSVPQNKADINQSRVTVSSYANRTNVLNSASYGWSDTEIERYVSYLKSKNLVFTPTNLLAAIRSNKLPASMLKTFIEKGLPISKEGEYEIRILDDAIYFVNKTDIASSIKASPSTGRISRIPATAIRQLAPRPETPRTRATRPTPTDLGAGERVAEPVGAPAAGAAAPTAGATTGGIAQAIEAVGLTTGFNALPTVYRNRILNGTIVNVRTDRTANSRQRDLGDRGRVLTAINSGADRMVIIRAGNNTFAQASFQPDARHYIITPTRALNMGRVGNFIDFISNQANLTETQKDIFTRIAYGAATKEEIDELKTKIKPKQDMKLTELKKMIQEEIEKILTEQPETQEKERTKTKPQTKPQTSPSKEDDEFGTTPTPGTEEGPRYKKKAEEAAEKVAGAIGKRYAKMLKK